MQTELFYGSTVLSSTLSDGQGMDISFTVCLCVCCTVTDFSAEDKFVGVQGRVLPFFGTLLSQKPQIRRIGQRAGHAHPHVSITVEMRRRLTLEMRRS